MSDYTTGSDILREKLKAKVVKMGRREIFRFTGISVKTASDEEINRIMDTTLDHMPKEIFYKALETYGLMPTYSYSGPEPGVWCEEAAYRKKENKTLTGSITIDHPVVQMMCRVGDEPSLPGFIITCKDENGETREFHVYMTPAGSPSIRVCTSVTTNQKLKDEDIIRKNYNIPFDNHCQKKEGK